MANESSPSGSPSAAVTPPAAAPASEETPAEAAPEAESTEAPAAEETTAVDSETAETETEETDGDGPVTPITGKRAHLRIAENDQVGRLAAALMKRNRDMPMSEAVAKASEQLGIKPQTNQQEVPKDDGRPSLPQTIQEVETLRNQKLAEYTKAMSEVRLDDAAKINGELLSLTEHRFSLERNADRQAVETEARFNRDWDSSVAKATELYPFAADPKSPGGKRMLEIEAELQRNGDPLYSSPNKPLKLAQMVAAELSIAPRAKKPAPAPAAVPAAPAPKKGVVTTGGSRTTPPPVNAKPEVQQKIEGIKSLNDLRQFSRSLGMRHI